jgi:hypothetical protein
MIPLPARDDASISGLEVAATRPLGNGALKIIFEFQNTVTLDGLEGMRYS